VAIENEETLVDLAIQGDESAFALLFDRHYDQVFRMIYYRLGRRQDAEDLAQQVFLQAWRAVGRYRRTASPFIAWLATIAHNTVSTYYRRQHKHTSLEETLTDLPSPEQLESVAELSLEHDRVREMMAHLPPQYTKVLTLRFVDDLSYAEIAGLLGKSEASVRVMQCRALQQLRRYLSSPTDTVETAPAA
jgi:RNA polymerase sigma-70 factor (ECF subfamily)